MQRPNDSSANTRYFGSGLLWICFALTLLSACGAKTGLNLPDVSIDAARDADVGMDAGIDADIPCIEIPFDGGPVDLSLNTNVVVGRADVVLAVDITASMGQEIAQIQENLRDRLIPGIRQAIPDSELAVSSFADFPSEPCGSASADDNPFRLILPVTGDVARIQSAVDSLRLGDGRDVPESQVEALYQIATGQGLPPYVPASFGCPRGGFGYPCFRTDSLPVVLLFTDAPFHGGQGNSNPYTCSTSARPHTYAQALDALRASGIRVMGLYSGDDGDAIPDLNNIALATGAISAGTPLVFDIGTRGERLSEGVIDAIRTLADVIQFDIDTLVIDANPGDGIDATRFVERVIPVSANPMSGIGSIDRENGVFRRVRTGTQVSFQVTLRNGAVAPGVGPQRFLLEIVFRGDGRTRIGSSTIEIVVPGADGNGC